MSDETKTFVIKFATETDAEELANVVADAISDPDDMLAFMLRLDEVNADYHLTKRLHEALGASLAAEDEAEGMERDGTVLLAELDGSGGV